MLFLFLTCIRVGNPKQKCDEKFVVKKPPSSSSSHLFCSIRERELERRERRETRDSERDTFARTHVIHIQRES